MSDLTLSPEHFIFASDNTLKTTSLKIAEAFGKLHKNVLRDIDNIIAQTVDLPNKLKFEPIETETSTGLGTRKCKAYEMDKDGFMIVVMSYTGAKAMSVKLAYINAFNLMFDRLFKQPQYGLKALPEPPTITKAQAGELKLLVDNKSRNSGKPNAYYWSRYQNHFHVHSYFSTPADRYAEAHAYLGRLEGDDADSFFVLTKAEMDKLAKVGELLPRPEGSTGNHMTLHLDGEDGEWLAIKRGNELSLRKLSEGEAVTSRQTLGRLAVRWQMLCVPVTDHGVRALVDDYLPVQLIPTLVEAAGARMVRIGGAA